MKHEITQDDLESFAEEFEGVGELLIAAACEFYLYRRGLPLEFAEVLGVWVDIDEFGVTFDTLKDDPRPFVQVVVPLSYVHDDRERARLRVQHEKNAEKFDVPVNMEDLT